MQRREAGQGIAPKPRGGDYVNRFTGEDLDRVRGMLPQILDWFSGGTSVSDKYTRRASRKVYPGVSGLIRAQTARN